MLVAVEMSNVELTEPPGFRVTLCGLSDTTRPLLETEKARLTVPEKPFSPVTVIVELPGEPTWNERDDGLATREKSVTTTVTSVEWRIVPLVVFPVPVTVTV